MRKSLMTASLSITGWTWSQPTMDDGEAGMEGSR